MYRRTIPSRYFKRPSVGKSGPAQKLPCICRFYRVAVPPSRSPQRLSHDVAEKLYRALQVADRFHAFWGWEAWLPHGLPGSRHAQQQAVMVAAWEASARSDLI